MHMRGPQPLRAVWCGAAEQRDARTSEYLGNKGAAGPKHVADDGHRRQQQLRLHVLVKVMKAGDVGGAVADDQVGVMAVKVGDNLFGSGGGRG